MNKKNMKYNIKYGTIQGFYWMMFCSVIGYLSTYLIDIDFNNMQIGGILAVANILAAIVQPLIADFIDRQNKISIITIISIMIGIMLSLSVVLLFLEVNTFGIYFLITPIVTIITTLHPFINSISFLYEKDNIDVNFGVCRGMGSLFYAGISSVIGVAIDKASPSVIPMFYIISMVGILIFVLIYGIKNLNDSKKDKNVCYMLNEMRETFNSENKMSKKRKKNGLIYFIKRYKKFMIFLIGATLVLFDHSLINNFFTQIVYNVSGTDREMGLALSLAAGIELPIMLVFYKLKNKINCGTLLRTSGISFVIKHILTYLADSIELLYAAQLLQLVAFGMFIPAAVFYVKQIMEEEDLVKGQAFITMAITIAGIFASLIGGPILDNYGASTMLLVGAGVSILGGILMFFTAEKIYYE